MIKLFKKDNRIYHIASMARSGETLMLKTLAVHPEIVVVHNLDKNDDIVKTQAFEFLKSYKKESIPRNHPVIKPYNLSKSQILLLKQGVWKHPYPFKGFVLSRNPISIYASLKVYDKDLPEYHDKDNFWFGNKERIFRWLKDIDKESIPLFKRKTPVEQFCMFYNLRMKQLLDTKLPIIRYEDLILNTEVTLKKVCGLLNVGMDKKLLSAHDFYGSGLEGHGKNDLSKPIDTSSLTKYKKNITKFEFDYIAKNTFHVYNQYGYKIVDFKVDLE
ncbi:hypothetical protein QLS71_012980 [Mariniflexile litorale]|uniref:Sulfotransferase family protein n=1 Tax=Mariniflexile litorale TaxID=3045158 RepID=A0AAU7ECS3_9FLAO|nr:hypothetical protein [Mariniflexile sp. KMM 9835]MDQ8212229.1 hypothetical protein [Mariniflexile sp. KMM 9835]